MKKVGIVMGSDSDMPVMSKAAAILDKLGVEYEMKIISAHKTFTPFYMPYFCTQRTGCVL